MATLDKFDILILTELQADARLTNTELAQRVGLSAAPCWRRVRALEGAGYILGYRAEIDRHRIGLGVLAFVRLDANRNTGEVTREHIVGFQHEGSFDTSLRIRSDGHLASQFAVDLNGEFDGRADQQRLVADRPRLVGQRLVVAQQAPQFFGEVRSKG